MTTLQIATQLDDIKDINVDDRTKLWSAVNNENKNKELLNTIFVSDPANIEAELNKYMKSDFAWAHLALCKLFGVQYTNKNKKALEYPSVSQVLAKLNAHNINPAITGTEISAIRQIERVGALLKTSIDKLNAMVVANVVSELTLNKVLTTMTGGAEEFDYPNYQSFANMIKHNNFMLLNYATNSINVSGYTAEMHGGGNAMSIDMADGTKFDLDTSDEIVYSDDSINKTDALNFGNMKNTIVNIVYKQIAALRNKNKTLSENSKKKVNAVIKKLSESYKHVNDTLHALNTYNTYKGGAVPVPDNISMAVADSPAYDAPIDTNNKYFRQLENAIREKNKRELKVLAVSEGLARALADAIGFRRVVSDNDLSIQ